MAEIKPIVLNIKLSEDNMYKVFKKFRRHADVLKKIAHLIRINIQHDPTLDK